MFDVRNFLIKELQNSDMSKNFNSIALMWKLNKNCQFVSARQLENYLLVQFHMFNATTVISSLLRKSQTKPFYEAVFDDPYQPCNDNKVLSVLMQQVDNTGNNYVRLVDNQGSLEWQPQILTNRQVWHMLWHDVSVNKYNGVKSKLLNKVKHDNTLDFGYELHLRANLSSLEIHILNDMLGKHFLVPVFSVLDILGVLNNLDMSKNRCDLRNLLNLYLINKYPNTDRIRLLNMESLNFIDLNDSIMLLNEKFDPKVYVHTVVQTNDLLKKLLIKN